MKLSLQSDYALRLLMALAANRDRLCTIAEIAAFYDISKNHLMKVAQSLVREGFVEGVRGRSGGLKLARPAEAIRLGDVLRCTEDFAVLGCMDASIGDSFCRVAPVCRLQGVLGEATKAFQGVFDAYSLADIVRDRASRAVLSIT